MLSRCLFSSAVRALPAFKALAPATVHVIPAATRFTALNISKSAFHSSAAVLGKIKTKKAAAKRFIKTGSGDLKYGKAGKRHLNKYKSRTRVSRLGEKGILEGVWAKKMKILVPY